MTEVEMKDHEGPIEEEEEVRCKGLPEQEGAGFSEVDPEEMEEEIYYEDLTREEKAKYLGVPPEEVEEEVYVKEKDGALYSAATPFPRSFTVEDRLRELHDSLDPENQFYESPKQHDNIHAVINAYEEGSLDLTKGTTYWRGGVQISWDDVERDCSWIWVESIVEDALLAGKQLYTSIDERKPHAHMLKVHLRLRHDRGGRNLVKKINVLNDTGSSILTLLQHDIIPLGSRNYQGWAHYVSVRIANGSTERLPSLWVEIRFGRDDGTPWSEWFLERAVAREGSPADLTRLSGTRMRRHFYFGTGPGNNGVAVASTKGGMASLI